jgi:hypothetical protein
MPLRMLILPCQRLRYRLMPAKPCPRPGSRNRLTFWISAASSAVASLHRSPKRFACAASSERRKPMPASLTAITTTRRPSRRRNVYACTATQPPVPACSTIFVHDSESAIEKPTLDLASRPSSPDMIRAAFAPIRPTTSCTSSDARTGVTSSSTSDGPDATARGTLPWISNRLAAWAKNPVRAQ